MKFRKRPVIIEATQWFKHGDHVNVIQNSPRWRMEIKAECASCDIPYEQHGWVETLEGGHVVCPADWIITDAKGEHHQCKPDIFEQTYEKVE